MSEFKPKVQNISFSRFHALRAVLLMASQYWFPLYFVPSAALPWYNSNACPPSPRGVPPGVPPGGDPPFSSHVYSVVFWDPHKILFWLRVWPHWASILSKLVPKRRHFEVWELPGTLTGNCTPALTGTPFSLFGEVIKLPLFEHFSKSILWRLNLNPSGFINTGIVQKVVQNGTTWESQIENLGPSGSPNDLRNWQFGH